MTNEIETACMLREDRRHVRVPEQSFTYSVAITLAKGIVSELVVAAVRTTRAASWSQRRAPRKVSVRQWPRGTKPRTRSVETV